MVYQDINKYIRYNTQTNRFVLSDNAKKIVGNYINTPDGCNKWCHQTLCNYLDLFSEVSEFNYNVDNNINWYSYLNRIYNQNPTAIVDWLKSINNDTPASNSLRLAVSVMTNIIKTMEKENKKD